MAAPLRMPTHYFAFLALLSVRRAQGFTGRLIHNQGTNTSAALQCGQRAT
jgi:hypothetical protein